MLLALSITLQLAIATEPLPSWNARDLSALDVIAVDALLGTPVANAHAIYPFGPNGPVTYRASGATDGAIHVSAPTSSIIEVRGEGYVTSQVKLPLWPASQPVTVELWPLRTFEVECLVESQPCQQLGLVVYSIWTEQWPTNDGQECTPTTDLAVWRCLGGAPPGMPYQPKVVLYSAGDPRRALETHWIPASSDTPVLGSTLARGGLE